MILSGALVVNVVSQVAENILTDQSHLKTPESVVARTSLEWPELWRFRPRSDSKGSNVSPFEAFVLQAGKRAAAGAQKRSVRDQTPCQLLPRYLRLCLNLTRARRKRRRDQVEIGRIRPPRTPRRPLGLTMAVSILCFRSSCSLVQETKVTVFKT